MSTTDRDPGTGSATTSTPATSAPAPASDGPAGARPERGVLLVTGAVTVLAGLAIYLIGLPEDTALFGTPLSDLTLPAALLVALGGIALTSAVRAHRPWRVVDIVVASVLGVAGGLLFAVWNVAWEALSRPFVPPVTAIAVGVWLLPAVLGGLVIRRPGAAVYTELVAATVSALIGNQWGFATVWYGLIEGLGAEVVFAVLLYRSFRLPVALAAGAGAGVAVGLLDSILYYPHLDAALRSAYIGLSVLSGVVIAGLGGWALTRALARTGVLSGLASGRTAERV